MANCLELFQQYHSEINIGTGKKEKMMGSKNGLRKRIRAWFKENHPEYDPKFFIQGSYKMKSGIRTYEDICDLDDGIYFFREPDVTSTTLQCWVLEAVSGYTELLPEHRKKCIRTTFSNDYEIDHPVYCKAEGQPFKIAVKKGGFENSDPKQMVEWFQKRKDKEGRLIRQVMYLKGWCDNKRNKMPSGLAMSILAANAKENIILNERDDISLRDILNEISKALKSNFECIVPAIPNDNLFAEYDENRKNNFLAALDAFLKDANDAIKEENELAASRKWRKHLGNRFPLGEDKKREPKSNILPLIIGGASKSNPWAK